MVDCTFALTKKKYLKRIYLILAVIGFVLPNIFVYQESIQTGNVLLWFDPQSTVRQMFSTNINSAFSMDLIFVFVVFFVWTYHQGLRYRMKNIWVIWVFSLLFGLAGPFPLFLYYREEKRKKRKSNSTKTRRMRSHESESASE